MKDRKTLVRFEHIVMWEYEHGAASCPVCGGHKFEERQDLQSGTGGLYLGHLGECEIAQLMGYPMDVWVSTG